MRFLLSSCGEGQSIADARGDDPVQKLLFKPSDVALLHKHIVESFQRFEHDSPNHGIGVGAGRLGSHRTPFRAVDAPEPRERA